LRGICGALGTVATCAGSTTVTLTREGASLVAVSSSVTSWGNTTPMAEAIALCASGRRISNGYVKQHGLGYSCRRDGVGEHRRILVQPKPLDHALGEALARQKTCVRSHPLLRQLAPLKRLSGGAGIRGRNEQPSRRVIHGRLNRAHD
jgi:hypothetical protein